MQRTAVRSSEFAAELNLTPPYLSRIAQDIVDGLIRSFLRDKQLAYAQQLLRTTPLSIEEIALSSGFGTANTFYRAFRKAFGTTPSKYREG